AQDFGSKLPLTRLPGSLTPAIASSYFGAYGVYPIVSAQRIGKNAFHRAVEYAASTGRNIHENTLRSPDLIGIHSGNDGAAVGGRRGAESTRAESPGHRDRASGRRLHGAAGDVFIHRAGEGKGLGTAFRHEICRCQNRKHGPGERKTANV